MILAVLWEVDGDDLSNVVAHPLTGELRERVDVRLVRRSAPDGHPYEASDGSPIYVLQGDVRIVREREEVST